MRKHERLPSPLAGVRNVRGDAECYSHSIVPGGLLVMS